MLKKIIVFLCFISTLISAGVLVNYQSQKKVDFIAYNYLFAFKNYIETQFKDKESIDLYQEFLGEPQEVVFPNNNINDLNNFLSTLGVPILDVRDKGKHIYFRDYLVAFLSQNGQQYHIANKETISVLMKKGFDLYKRELIDPSIFNKLKINRHQKSIPYTSQELHKNQYIERFVIKNDEILGTNDLNMHIASTELESNIQQLMKVKKKESNQSVLRSIKIKAQEKKYNFSAIYISKQGTGFAVLSHHLSLKDVLYINKTLLIVLSVLMTLFFLIYLRLQKIKTNKEPVAESKQTDALKIEKKGSDPLPQLEEGSSSGYYQDDLLIEKPTRSSPAPQIDDTHKPKVDDVVDIIRYLENQKRELLDNQIIYKLGAENTVDLFHKQLKIQGSFSKSPLVFQLIGAKKLSFKEGEVLFVYSLKIWADTKELLKTYSEKMIDFFSKELSEYQKAKGEFDVYHSQEGYFYNFNKSFQAYLEYTPLLNQVQGTIGIIRKDLFLYRFVGDENAVSLLSVMNEEVSIVEKNEKEHSSNTHMDMKPFQAFLEKLHPYFKSSFLIRTKKIKNKEDIYLIDTKHSFSKEGIIGLIKKNQGYYKSIIADLELSYIKQEQAAGFSLTRLHSYLNEDDLIGTIPPLMQKKQLGFIESANEFFRKELYTNAAESLENAIKIKSSEKIYLDLVNTYFLIKNYDKALVILDKAQKNYPANEILLYYQSIAYYRAKNNDNAIRSSMRLYIIDPKNKKNVSNLVQLIKKIHPTQI